MRLEGIYEKYTITEGSIKAACGGLEDTRKAVGCETKFSCLSNHFDILSIVDFKLKASPLQWSWCHVKGHQYDHIRPLNRWATLNVEYDRAEKYIWIRDQEIRPDQITYQ